jgi:hypothetical protein
MVPTASKKHLSLYYTNAFLLWIGIKFLIAFEKFAAFKHYTGKNLRNHKWKLIAGSGALTALAVIAFANRHNKSSLSLEFSRVAQINERKQNPS